MNQLPGAPDSLAQYGSTASGSEACLPGGLSPAGRRGTANPVQAHLSAGASIGRARSSQYLLKLTLNINQTALGTNFRIFRSFQSVWAGAHLLHGDSRLESSAYGAGINYRSP